MGEFDKDKILQLGQAVLQTEAEAVTQLISRVDDNFVKACHYILACSGRTVVIGMGKSGHIGGKLAATLASTGSPAFFVHPGEASHGDLGMITSNDVVLALSNSGETDEVIALLPMIKRLGVPLVAFTGNLDSTLAREAAVAIDVGVNKEACPLGLAPTASTTAALAMGDAIAIALLEARGFSSDDFALAHPGGALGRRLLLHVSDIMHTGNEIPVVTGDTSLSETLVEMSAKGLGTTAIVDENNKVCGIYTDGDLRRTLDRNIDIKNTTVSEVIGGHCKTIHQDKLAAEALAMMETYKINALLVVNEDNTLIGILNMHDLLRARVV